MIDLIQWRGSIGAYNAIQCRSATPRSARSKVTVEKVRAVGCCMALMLFALLPLTLLPLAGDIETNPGPPKITGEFHREVATDI